MHRISFVERGLLWLVAPLVMAANGCKLDRDERDSLRPGKVLPAATPKAKPVHMPGAIPQEVEPVTAEARLASAVVKSRGKLGERLEGDVYYFKAHAARPCDDTGKLVGIEVEIEAKAKLSISPRDVVLGKGGITFNGNLDTSSKLPSCAPLLHISALKKGEVARGFVLFDLPYRPHNDLSLLYQPTRWGGAGYVTVPLIEWAVGP